MAVSSEVASDRLLPCPFCGCVAVMCDIFLSSSDWTKSYMVECTNPRCYAQGKCRTTTEEAIAFWNTRGAQTAEQEVYAVGPAGVHVGDVLCVSAVDWGIYTEQTSINAKYSIVHATIYGEVIYVDDDCFAIAPQVFRDGDARCTLVVPFVCVSRVEVLKRAGE